MSEGFPTRWVTVSASVQGSAHVRSGTPNQDAVECFVGSDGLPPVVLAVSDGHGSARCYRSDVGARLAVNGAVELSRRFLEEAGLSSSSLAEIKQAAEQRLPGQIVRHWTSAVLAHFAAHPMTVEEEGRLKAAGIATNLPTVLAYGATLLLVAVGQNFVFYLQIGDGDFLYVTDEDGFVHEPVPSDAGLIANETTSLCMERAQRYFRTAFHPFPNPGGLPALIVASTDGYRNSFRDADDYRQVATDLLGIVRTREKAYLESSLPDWLAEASREGSGDDVTLGIIYRQEQLGKPEAAIEERAREGANDTVLIEVEDRHQTLEKAHERTA